MHQQDTQSATTLVRAILPGYGAGRVMDGIARRTKAFGRWSAMLLLALFVFNVADPTPHFLGFRRLPPQPRIAAKRTQKVRCELARFELPPAFAERATAGEDVRCADTGLAIPRARLGADAPIATRIVDERVGERREAWRGAPPPLRC
jgi:hypothetical protein